jgi:hypothetical protein
MTPAAREPAQFVANVASGEFRPSETRTKVNSTPAA